jgi:hypothetical protein
MEDFAVTCPLVPNVPHLRSGSCTSPRAFGLGFLQTPPRDDALALLLAFGSSLYLASGLAPDEFCAMPGTHDEAQRPDDSGEAAVGRSAAAPGSAAARKELGFDCPAASAGHGARAG